MCVCVMIGNGLKQVIGFLYVYVPYICKLYVSYMCVCPVKLNVRKRPIPNICYAVNACGRVSSRDQWVELDLGDIFSVG